MAGVIDLQQAVFDQEKMQMLKQAQAREQWGEVFKAISGAIDKYSKSKKEKMTRDSQSQFLKEMGIMTETPETKTVMQKGEAKPGSIEWNKVAEMLGMSPKGPVMTDMPTEVPTGKMKTSYDFSKVPAGMNFTMPDTGFEVKGTTSDMFSQLLQSGGKLGQDAQGNAIIDIGGMSFPISAISKGGIRFNNQENQKGISPTSALSILADPFKAQQFKSTYPEQYALLEEIASSGFSGMGQQNNAADDLIDVINPKGKPTRIKRSDLPAALKSGYKL